MSSIEEVAIRPAADGDAAGIAAVFAHYVSNTVITFEVRSPTPEDWCDRMRALGQAGMPFIVIERGGELLGFAYASAWRPKPAYRHTVEDTVYLAPAHTGRGYGRRLLDDLVARCVGAGFRQMIAVIADTGEPASTRLHLSAGFQLVGRLRRVGHKHDRWVDTVLMQRNLRERSR